MHLAPAGNEGVKPTPPPPSPVPGTGDLISSFVAQVVTSKIADHLPLYRQQDILARSGIELSRSTLCQIMAKMQASWVGRWQTS